jgi:excisionase family DNA binding protein
MAVYDFPRPETPTLDQILRDTIREAVHDEFAAYVAPEPTLAVNLTEAARELRTSPETVRRLIHDGYLPTVEMGTNRHIIPRRALEAYINGAS